ncbi:hypothetical protein EJ03DRAFT_324606 [Teratosphaeria nubilosa]|uniref:PCI domain-containing protein n=1 Tax=Teratosphaeria nubilosa TaxID=161662 RepID=A0A6G1LJJ5_9PEZI|nr:hypothetical protein EJ03DRAFT_324606 [Teratosphaeria nubilosa]
MATADARLGQYLIQINGLVAARNESSLARFIALEPPFDAGHQALIDELRNVYPRGKEGVLEQKCTQLLTAGVEGDDGGGSWTSFVKFMVQYLNYLRDISADASKYLQTYELLSELQQRANSALSHSTLGHLILPVVIVNAKLVCRLAIGLDRQPELIAHLRSGGQARGDDGTSRETLPERAANTIRGAFVTCLNDRLSDLSASGHPEGKKRGIYTLANLCLKILFQCRKTRNATQLFDNLYTQSPPLAAYPKRDRVTFLYYLGRFLFQNSHFYRAAQALQHAYDESPAHPSCRPQRRHVLIYLLASNIILGRFPTPALLATPEAHNLPAYFLPLCHAIRTGSLSAFHRHLSLSSPHAPWLLHHRLLLPLRNRCEPLVWRSLIRKTWNTIGVRPDPGSKTAPHCYLAQLTTAFHLMRQEEQEEEEDTYTDPDFTSLTFPPPSAATQSAENLLDISSKLSSLIDQGLISGFIAHRSGRFAIKGAAKHDGDALAAGFPKPYAVLTAKAKAAGEDVVPGWKKEGVGLRLGGVVRLSGVRGVGA